MNNNTKNTMILAWLNEQKAKGIKHIDELIDILKPRQYIAPIQIQEKRNENITQSVEKVSNKTDIGNAEFLLYFGSFLA